MSPDDPDALRACPTSREAVHAHRAGPRRSRRAERVEARARSRREYAHEEREAPHHPQAAAGARAVREGRRVRRAGRQGADRRRVHRPHDARPALVRRPAPGGRGQGGRARSRARRRRSPRSRIQNYFRMYEKLAGMTGTAETEETEFYQIYGLDVVGHPDQPADAPRATRTTSSTRPGARSTTRSSTRSSACTSWGCRCWSAPSSVEVSRDAVAHAQAPRAQAQGAERQVPPARGRDRGAGRASRARSRSRPTWPAAAPTSSSDKELDLTQEEAGLQIIGTERHESRRIDRQLRGRSGRQGDPGQSHLLPVARRRPDAAVRLRPHRRPGWTRAVPRRARSSPHALGHARHRAARRSGSSCRTSRPASGCSSTTT